MTDLPDPIVSLLEEIRAQGVDIDTDGRHVYCWSTSALPAGLWERIVAHELELVRLLAPDGFNVFDATYGEPGKTWPDRTARLLESSVSAAWRAELGEQFERTAGMLVFESGLHMADAEMKAFGQTLFNVLRLGIDARAVR